MPTPETSYESAIRDIPDRVSWWRLGDAAGPRAEDQQGAQDGGYKGGVTFDQPPLPAGTSDRGIALDGVDGHVEIAPNDAHKLADGTALIWFNLDHLNRDHGLLSKDTRDRRGGETTLWYRQPENALKWLISDGSSNHVIEVVGALTAGRTYCAVLVWGAGGMKLYLANDGLVQLRGTDPHTRGLSGNTNPLYLGASGAAGPPAIFAAGRIGDVVIWKRPLSEAEIERATQATLIEAPAELALCYPDSGRKVDVSSASELTSALSIAAAGDRILVAGGPYGGTFTLAKSGTKSAPVVIAAASGQTPVFTGTFNLNANHGVLERLRFDGGVVRVAGNFNRVTRSRFTNFAATAVQIMSGGSHNRIDHNEFAEMVKETDESKRGYVAVAVMPDMGNTATIGNRIDHNHFHDFPHGSANGHEAMWLGVAATQVGTLGNSLIDHNLFERTDADFEIIKCVTVGNRIVNNTFLQCRGVPSNRQGKGTLIKNNFLEDCDGINVFSDDCQVIGNNLGGKPVRLIAGDITHDEVVAQLPNPTTLRTSARRALVVGNIGDIDVGHPSPGTVVASDNVLEENTGEVILNKQVNTTIRPTTSINYGVAVKLSAGEVGPNAADPSCPG